MTLFPNEVTIWSIEDSTSTLFKVGQRGTIKSITLFLPSTRNLFIPSGLALVCPFLCLSCSSTAPGLHLNVIYQKDFPWPFTNTLCSLLLLCNTYHQLHAMYLLAYLFMFFFSFSKIKIPPEPEVSSLWIVEENRINKEDIRVKAGGCDKQMFSNTSKSHTHTN